MCVSIQEVQTATGYAAAVELFREYEQGLGIDLCFQNFEDELKNIPLKYGPPTGALWVLKDTDAFVGCVAIWKLEEGICELKRMYIKPAYRGQQWGQKLLESAQQKAKTMGYDFMRLDTLERLTPAIELYQKSGFTEIKPYNYNPENDVRYFEKKLKDG
jgi:putative acetyltransferase